MTRRTVIALILGVAALGGIGCDKKPAADKPGGDEAALKQLTVDQVAQRLATKDGATYIFDNNTKASYAEGHVPGAKWLDESNVTAADLPADKAATLIFYCHNES